MDIISVDLENSVTRCVPGYSDRICITADKITLSSVTTMMMYNGVDGKFGYENGSVYFARISHLDGNRWTVDAAGLNPIAYGSHNAVFKEWIIV